MERLRKLAKKENINIVYLPLFKQRVGLWGMYVPEEQGRNPVIYLDRELIENPKLYKLARCVFAEELGHHFTGVKPFFKVHPNYSFRQKMSADADDDKALRWATNKLIPTPELISLIEDGVCECVDLIGYFCVTNWFMFRKMEFLQYQVRAKRPDISKNLTWNLVSKVKISCIY